jgi:hypothetical protein
MAAWIPLWLPHAWWWRDTVYDAPLRNERLCSATASMFVFGIFARPFVCVSSRSLIFWDAAAHYVGEYF